MIDVHSHIINEIDDGSKSINESVDIIKKLKGIGFSKIIATPHFMEGTKYNASNSIKKKKFNLLEKTIKKENINIDLYLGNEIYINYEISNLIEKKKIYPMNNTKYLLIELSLYNEIHHVEDYLDKLKIEGYIPIIAHPERYLYFQKNYKKMHELYDSGVLFQCNYGSIIGLYGPDAKKLLKYMLKKDMVTFMGTDIHSKSFPLIDSFNKATKKIKKITGEQKFKEITEENALKMINNEETEY